MKKISSLSLMLIFLCSVFTVNAQIQETTTTTQTGTIPSSTGLSPSTATVPGVGAISEGTLQSLGFTQEEIDAVMSSLGQPTTTTTTTTSAIEQATILQQEGTQAATQQQVLTTTPATTIQDAVVAVVADTGKTGDPGTVFGQDFFRNGNITLYEKVPNAKVSDNYILGSGDQISVSAYGGPSSYNQSFTINDDGYIDVYGVGRIYLQGLTFEGAKKLLRQRISSYVNVGGGNFDVELVYSKNIKVNIVGEVVSPGSYNVASINTAFNALTAAGGPTNIGSVRNIQVKRNNKVIKTLDVYQFLVNPGNTDDTYLQDNDYIVVQPLGRVVQILGEVNRPHKYELINGENLNELIFYAGGLKSTAYKRNVTIKRYSDNENVILDINLDSIIKGGINFQVLDGDIVTFAKIPETIENVVTVQGAVRFPGTYQLTEGIRISDVISKAKGLTYEAYTHRAYLIRKNAKLNDVYIPFDLEEVMKDPNSPFNFALTKFDVIDIFSKEKFRETFNVTVEGAVKAPGTFSYYEKMTLKDILYYTGGLRVEAANNKIEISRIINLSAAESQGEPTRVVIETIQIGKDLEISDAAETFQLQPYDIIFIRTTPEFELQKNVLVQGEVLYPGTYTLLSKTETIADVIERAGGTTQYAYVQGATIARDNITNTLLFLDKALKDPGSKFNYVLRAGDIIMVPKQGDLVTLEGAIEFPFIGETGTVMVPFEKGKSAKYYVKKYGKNFDDDAERKDTYIVQPNGYVKRTHNFLFIHFYPHVKVKGSKIVVPEEEKKAIDPVVPEPDPIPFDWNVFVATMSAGILAFATIYVLINNSNRN
ncbi:MAG: SLBB domain-containing protein [Chitinophagales bacterium]|nr:SLBB domain-containing protein [Chitinophagales bacterium]